MTALVIVAYMALLAVMLWQLIRNRRLHRRLKEHKREMSSRLDELIEETRRLQEKWESAIDLRAEIDRQAKDVEERRQKLNGITALSAEISEQLEVRSAKLRMHESCDEQNQKIKVLAMRLIKLNSEPPDLGVNLGRSMLPLIEMVSGIGPHDYKVRH